MISSCHRVCIVVAVNTNKNDDKSFRDEKKKKDSKS